MMHRWLILMLGTGICPQISPYRVSPAAGDPEDRRRETVPLLQLRPTSVLRSFGPRPQGRLKAHMAGDNERAACPSADFSAVRRQLQHPRPTVDPSVPFFAKNIPQTSFSSGRENVYEYLVAGKTYRTGRARDPCVGVRILCFSKTIRTGLPDSS
jgi:hypothetical protein